MTHGSKAGYDLRHKTVSSFQSGLSIVELETWNSNLSFSRAPEGAHAEVGKQQSESRRQQHFSRRAIAGDVAMMFADSSGRPDKCQRKKEQPGHFQPEDVQHAAEISHGYGARPVQ